MGSLCVYRMRSIHTPLLVALGRCIVWRGCRCFCWMISREGEGLPVRHVVLYGCGCIITVSARWLHCSQGAIYRRLRRVTRTMIGCPVLYCYRNCVGTRFSTGRFVVGVYVNEGAGVLNKSVEIGLAQGEYSMMAFAAKTTLSALRVCRSP